MRGLSERRAQQVAGPVWAGIWLWPFLAPVSAMIDGRVHPLLPAAIGLAAFIVLYIVIIVAAFDDESRYSPRKIVVLLGVLAAIGLILSGVYTGQPDGWITPLSFVSTCGAAVLLRPSRFLPWMLACCGAIAVVALAHGQTWAYVGADVFVTVMGSLLVFIVRQQVKLIRELRATQQALADTAVEQERLRFARDLHDLLGHTLSLMVVKAEVARRVGPTDPAAAAREAADIETIGRRALAEVREAVTGYRERTLAAELAGARSALADAGIEATVRAPVTPLPPPVDDAFAWAVREGVTNVIRHSGASRCQISVSDSTLTVEDNGVTPSPPAPAGNGLRGLSERLELLGGSLRAGPSPSGGFRLTALVPEGGAA